MARLDTINWIMDPSSLILPQFPVLLIIVHAYGMTCECILRHNLGFVRQQFELLSQSQLDRALGSTRGRYVLALTVDQ